MDDEYLTVSQVNAYLKNKLKKDVDFVVHTHQPNASAVSVLGETFSLTATNGNLRADRITTAEQRALLGPTIPTANYGLSSTPPLAANVRRAIRRNPDSKAVLMKSHGALCFGADYEEAFKAAYALEEVCGRIFEIRCGCKMPTESGQTIEGEIDKGYMKHVRTPFIMRMSERGKDVKAYLDDQAQISGRRVKCIEPNDRVALKSMAEKGGSALIKNDGAIIMAMDEDETPILSMLVGFSLVDAATGKHIGTIEGINDQTANVLFELSGGQLIPASDELIMNIDTQREEIVMDIPEGLLEI